MRSLFLAIAAFSLTIISAGAVGSSPEVKVAVDRAFRQLRESHGVWSVPAARRGKLRSNSLVFTGRRIS